MSGPTAPTAAWFGEQRWFAGQAAGATPGRARSNPIGGSLVVDLVDVGDDTYQLVSRHGGEDSLAHPDTARELVEALRTGAAVSGPAGDLAFHLCHGVDLVNGKVRPAGVEQSNSSLIIDDRWMLKVFRRIQPGTNPELEILRFLTDRSAAHVPRLAGWYELSGGPLEGTLGILVELVPDAVDGWTWMLERLPWRPEDTIEPLHRLGAVIATLHRTLADHDDEGAFGTSEGGPELARSIAEGIAADASRVADALPEGHQHERPALAAAARRADELADGLDAGRAQRLHGDLHLGQLLIGAGGWTVIDWEGEPSRPIEERRTHQPALRDLAGLLRSLSYAAATTERTVGTRPLHGWLAAARSALLDGYLSTADPQLLPQQPGATRRLLALLELEKAVYEVGYEAAHRPDWLDIPVAALARATEGRAA